MDRINDEILIEKALNKELTDEELTEFRKKLNEDKDFHEKVKDYASLVVSLKASNRVLGEKNVNMVFLRKLAVAASIILILSIATLITINQFNGTELSEQTINSKNLEKYADLFKGEEFLPNQVLENNLLVNYRNIEAIPVILTPGDSVSIKLNEEILFEIDNKQKLNYNIQVYNNKLERVIQTPDINVNKFSYKNELPIGLYYIKIQTAQSSVWVSRLFIVPANSSAN